MNTYFRMAIATIAIFLTTTYCYSQGATANWKTYKNDHYGFSFQYPGKWIMDQDTDIVVSGIVTARSIHFIDLGSKTFLLINYSLAKGTEIYNFYIANYDPIHSKKIKVDGGDAIQITTIDDKNGKGKLLNRKDQGKEIDVEFLDKKKTGAIELKFRARLNANLENEVKKFNYLVNSFKFLK